MKQKTGWLDGLAKGARVNRRGLFRLAVLAVPISLWFASVTIVSAPASAQQAVRRAGEERDVKAHAQRQRTLARLLISSTRNFSAVTVDGGSTGNDQLAIHTGKLEVGAVDFESLDRLAPGDIQVITMAAATKFSIDRTLVFPDATLAASNPSSSSGVFSVWLKRVEDGWRLVFNREADVWGTQRDPAMDVAEAAASYESSEDSTQELTPSLTLSDTKGQLRLSWGPHRWTAEFALEAP